jgi:hypothetical protein
MLVSVGTGKDVVARRERGGWGLVETFGELIIESETSSCLLALLAALLALLAALLDAYSLLLLITTRHLQAS